METETNITEMVAVLSDDDLSELKKKVPGLKPDFMQHIDQCIRFYLSAYEPDKDVRAMLAQLRFEHGIRALAEKKGCDAIHYRMQPFSYDNGTDVEVCAFVEFYKIGK